MAPNKVVTKAPSKITITWPTKRPTSWTRTPAPTTNVVVEQDKSPRCASGSVLEQASNAAMVVHGTVISESFSKYFAYQRTIEVEVTKYYCGSGPKVIKVTAFNTANYDWSCTPAVPQVGQEIVVPLCALPSHIPKDNLFPILHKSNANWGLFQRGPSAIETKQLEDLCGSANVADEALEFAIAQGSCGKPI
jgi:hypothetical protein